MSLSQIGPGVVIAIAGLLSPVRGGTAQAITPIDTTVECDYRACGLTISPTWNGLAVVRGTSGATVANLNFFLPRDISAALSANKQVALGSDSVAPAARRAVQLRRIGAVFTDVGLVALAASSVRSVTSAPNKRVNKVLAGVGLGALGISVPFQFAADGALSRAVWWYNLRYARTNQGGAQ